MSLSASLGWTAGIPGGGITYATWDPAFVGNHIVITAGNLRAYGGGGGGFQELTRSTIGVTSGKWYWEVTCTTDIGAGFDIGICNSSESTSHYVGGSVNSWAYDSANAPGDKVHNGSFVAYGAAFVQGDIIGVALDMNGGTVIFYKNNVAQGTAYSSGITGTMYAAVTPWNTSVVVANFGASAMAYSPPAGYNAGLYA